MNKTISNNTMNMADNITTKQQPNNIARQRDYQEERENKTNIKKTLKTIRVRPHSN